MKENTKTIAYFDPDSKTIQTTEEKTSLPFDEEQLVKVVKTVNEYCVYTTVSLVLEGITMPFTKGIFDKIVCKIGCNAIAGIVMKEIKPQVDDSAEEAVRSAIDIYTQVKEGIDNYRKEN